jgi:DNA-binding SARP family transcriptional activator
MTCLRIQFMGPPTILQGTISVGHELSRKGLAILAYLMLGPARAYASSRLAEMFWGRASQENANYNLRRALWSVRKAINPPESSSDHYIGYEGGYYFFDKQREYWLDVEAFRAALPIKNQDSLRTDLLSGSRMNQGERLPDVMLSDAIKLYRGRFLEGCKPRGCPEFGDWLAIERELLEERLVKCFGLLASCHLAKGEYLQAIVNFQRALKFDSLDEATHCGLMIAYYRMGRRNRAIEHYLRFRETLRKRLDLAPLLETQALYKDIRDNSGQVDFKFNWSS